MEADVELTFGEVERVLMALHGLVGEKRRVTLRSRLQHLQRAGFPPGVKVGRGPKVAYGPDGFFQLVLALQLAEARIPPVHAARLVVAGWAALRRFVDDGMALYRAGARAPGQPDRWCVVELAGLSGLRADGVDEVEKVHEVAAAVLVAEMLGGAPPPRGPRLLVDVTGLTVRALVALDADRREKTGMD